MSKSNKKNIKRIYPKAPETLLTPYLMPKRNEAEVYINQELDITDLLKWIEEKNKTLNHKMTFFHAMVAIMGKTVYFRPLLNRFVKGKKFYQREDISVSFISKNDFSDESERRAIVFTIDENELPIELSERLFNEIHTSKETGRSNSGDIYQKISNLPLFVLNILAKIIRGLDKIGKLPTSMTKDDYNYASVLISNLGSVKCGSIYHHLNDYGTNSVLITIGIIHKVDGRDIVDISAVLDERIADGFYFAKSFNYLRYIASNPHLLDEKISKEIDVEL